MWKSSLNLHPIPNKCLIESNILQHFAAVQYFFRTELNIKQLAPDRADLVVKVPWSVTNLGHIFGLRPIFIPFLLLITDTTPAETQLEQLELESNWWFENVALIMKFENFVYRSVASLLQANWRWKHRICRHP